MPALSIRTPSAATRIPSVGRHQAVSSDDGAMLKQEDTTLRLLMRARSLPVRRDRFRDGSSIRLASVWDDT
jgi:hypothetical protein